MAQQLSYGWRREMVQTIEDRIATRPEWLTDRRLWVAGSRWDALRLIGVGLRSPEVVGSVMATFVAGLPGELLWRQQRVGGVSRRTAPEKPR